MSAPTTGPETLGTLNEEPTVEPAAPKGRRKNRKKADGPIVGKSPLQIALGRLMHDKIAMVCFAVVMVFVFVAVFAGVIADAFHVSLESVLPSQFIDGLNGGLPKKGPRCTALTPLTPSASPRAPPTTTWPTGSTGAARRFPSRGCRRWRPP